MDRDHDAALGLFRGPDLIVECLNDELLALTGMDPIGMPAREVWMEPQATTSQALMLATLKDGIDRRHPALDTRGRVGTVHIERVTLPDGAPGIATCFEPWPVLGKRPSPAVPVDSSPRPETEAPAR